MEPKVQAEQCVTKAKPLEPSQGGAKAETMGRQAEVEQWIQRLEVKPGDPLG